MERNAELHRAWAEANGKVRDAEDRLHGAWQDFAAGRGRPPDKALIEEVALLRHECDKKLTAILNDSFRPTPGDSERPQS
jgi:hypothetical protein